MRLAYALLGVAFLVLTVGAAYFSAQKETGRSVDSNVPSTIGEDTSAPLKDNQENMLTLASSAFSENGHIPSTYTCDGKNVNPPLRISGVPEGTRSLALIMDDPDIPDFVKERMGISVFDHWVLFNLPPDTNVVAENAIPEGAVSGKNSGGQNGYSGPCPPDREHRYFWKLYALDTVLELEEGATKAQVEKAMEGHALATTTLLSRYARLAK